MSRFGWLMAACVALIVAFLIVAPVEKTPPQPSLWGSACRDQADQMKRVLESWTGKVVRSISGDKVIVDEVPWAQISHDAKVSIGISAFCGNSQDGRGSAFMFGYRDGKLKASVIDGTYLD